MALEFVVTDAKKRGLRRVQEAMFSGKYVSPYKGKIVGDDDEPPTAAKQQDASCDSNQKPAIASGKSWEKCKHRVQQGAKSLCRKFVSGCAEANARRRT